MTNCLVGHRGASADTPENTPLSFRTAVRNGMNAFELDVVQSKDGVPFVMHDDRVDRTSNGTGNCYDLPWSSIVDLDAGSWKSAEFSKEKVVKFEDLLDCYHKQPIFILVELKGDPHYHSLPQRAAQFIREREMENQCLVMSFNWDYVDTVKAENV